MSIYPRPCDTCEIRGECENVGSRYKTCRDWQIWFRWWWKQFNLYAKRHGIEPTTPPTPAEEMEEMENDD